MVNRPLCFQKYYKVLYEQYLVQSTLRAGHRSQFLSCTNFVMRRLLCYDYWKSGQKLLVVIKIASRRFAIWRVRYVEFLTKFLFPTSEGEIDCSNYNIRCRKFAKEGACQKNVLFMAMSCRKACNMCGQPNTELPRKFHNKNNISHFVLYIC